jgi:hypothetical protein
MPAVTTGFEGRGPELTLIGFQDDATSRILAAHFQLEVVKAVAGKDHRYSNTWCGPAIVQGQLAVVYCELNRRACK